MSTGSEDKRGQGRLAPADAAYAAAAGKRKRTLAHDKRGKADAFGIEQDAAGSKPVQARAEGGAVSSGAGADMPGAPHADAPLPRLMQEDRRAIRRRVAAVGAVLAVLVVASLAITKASPMFVSLPEVFSCYALAASQLVNGIVNPAQVLSFDDILAAHPLYYHILANAGRVLIYVVCGVLLALAGALYQNVFRNPIASPAMLGVSSGIQLGVAVLVLVFGTAAADMLAGRYAVCYLVVAIVLAVLFACSALMSGKGRPINVVNMLVVGTIINQLVGVIVSYLTWYALQDELLDVYLYLTTYVVPVSNAVSWAILAVAVLVGAVPIFALRFRLNLLGFGPQDMKVMGVSSVRLQLLALVCGSIMMITAQLQVGAVAMVTLVVPHISRALFGAEFSKQFAGNLLLGAAVLVACYLIASAIPYNGDIPLGTVVNLVVLPAFVWIIATQQRKWD